MSESPPTALILAGGLGTRLRSVVADRPKVLAPVHGRPFLAYLLDQLADAGIRHAVLCTGFRGDLVRAEFGLRYRTLRLDYSQEHAPLGTGGALRQGVSLARSQTVLAMNGDSYCDADLQAFQARHAARKEVAGLLLTEVSDTSRYGRVQLDPEGRIQRFVEKGVEGGRGWINAGLYLLPVKLLETVPLEEPTSIERDLLPAWIPQGLWGFPCHGKFLDIGTPETFAATEAFFPPPAEDNRRSA
ncbi:MAG: nucleotidyltransferase family protein [Planctomycetales bacterium]